MNTRSSSDDILSPLSDPERIIRHNHRVDFSSLNNVNDLNTNRVHFPTVEEMNHNGQNVEHPPVGGQPNGAPNVGAQPLYDL